VSVIDIETGMSVLDLPVPQFADAVNATKYGAPLVALAVVQGRHVIFPVEDEGTVRRQTW
jgi:hypothetical protein